MVNIAHALGIVELKLHQWQITAAVGCGYKFLSAGPGGPSFVFIHESESTDNLLPIGWFSHESPIDALQGIPSPIKKGAQRLEASNPNVLGWLPFFAALEEYCRWSPEQLDVKRTSLLSYFDALMFEVQKVFGNPITVITPANERVTELIFTTTDETKAPALHAFINERGVICDIRKKTKIRIGMFPLITTHSDVCKLFNAIWDYYEAK